MPQCPAGVRLVVIICAGGSEGTREMADEKPVQPAYELPSPNHPLVLYEGDAEFRGRPGRAWVRLQFAPKPDTRFEFEDRGDRPWRIAFMGPDAGGEERLHLSEIDHDIGVEVTTSGTGILSGPTAARGVSLDGEGVDDLQRVVFHVLNFRIGLGGGAPLHNATASWLGRRRFGGGGWLVTLDECVGGASVAEELKQKGGYAFTHVGLLERENGSRFTADEARAALWAIHGALSFAKAAWTGPALPVGYTAGGLVAWREWGDRHLSEWQTPMSWLDDRRANGFPDVAGRFLDKWFSDDCWQQTLWRIVGLYVGANSGGGREVVFIESRIILAQSALEMFAWVILDDGCNQPVGQEQRPPREEASKRIRQLLDRAGIPADIPAAMSALAAYALQVDASDAPEAVTRLRNRLAHPRRKAGAYGAPSAALVDAWRLIVWWLELLTLFELGYTGLYASRLIEGRWVGTVEPVPWANTGDEDVD